MKINQNLYCKDSRDCPPNKTCINGECVWDIVPPPNCPEGTVYNPETNTCDPVD